MFNQLHDDVGVPFLCCKVQRCVSIALLLMKNNNNNNNNDDDDGDEEEEEAFKRAKAQLW